MASTSIVLLVLIVLLGLVAGGVILYRRRLPPPPTPSSLPEPPQHPEPLAPAEPGPWSEEVVPEPEVAVVAPVMAPAAPADSEVKASFFARLKAGLARTHQQLVERLDQVFLGRKEIDDELFEELEMVLLTADVGVKTTTNLMEQLREGMKREQLKDPAALRVELQRLIEGILGRNETSLTPMEGKSPYVIMIVGVNGVGKTTTIGKLSMHFTRMDKKVVLAAGDTFRAAAIEQLEVWAGRSGAQLVRKGEGSDPSAVAFDALDTAKKEGADVVICDTAGRLHTKIDLMDELKKIHRVIGKVVPGAPHEVLLVLDSTTGQNAVVQARTFNEGCPLTGLVLTKLDGTAKGGIIISICDELRVPVKFIGIGEKVDDLRPFDPSDFAKALFS